MCVYAQHLSTSSLRVELCRASGLDFTTLGVALVPLRWATEDLEAGTTAGTRSAMTHFADVLGAGGQCLGSVRLQLLLSPTILAPLRAFRQLRSSAVGAASKVRHWV